MELMCAADALSWGADKLLVPVLTGVAVGLALRAAAIPREVNDHDARAEELSADLSRWVRDRDRELGADIWRAVNLAKQGVIEDLGATDGCHYLFEQLSVDGATLYYANEPYDAGVCP